MSQKTFEAALEYIEHGLAVYPAGPEKNALIRRWNDSAAARNENLAERYFLREFPNAQLGVACGPSALVVVDVDPRNGGNESFRALCNNVGLEVFESAPTVLTPGGGWHMWFRAPESEVRSGTSVLGRGIDVQGTKAGVMVPPSERTVGAYRWRTWDGNMPDLSAMSVFPEALLDRITSVHQDAARHAEQHAVARNERGKVLEGSRNRLLFKALGDLARLGFGAETLAQAAAAINANEFEIAYGQDERMDIVTWALRRANGDIVDPAVWFAKWGPRISDPDQFRFAALASNAAAAVVGPYTPARKVLLDMTGFGKDKLYKVREGLEALGSMRFIERGAERATIIEFIMPESAESNT